MDSKFKLIFSLVFIVFFTLNLINLFEPTLAEFIASIFVALIEAVIPSVILFLIYRLIIKTA